MKYEILFCPNSGQNKINIQFVSVVKYCDYIRRSRHAQLCPLPHRISRKVPKIASESRSQDPGHERIFAQFRGFQSLHLRKTFCNNIAWTAVGTIVRSVAVLHVLQQWAFKDQIPHDMAYVWLERNKAVLKSGRAVVQ